ncbi:hypothetical protein B4U84_29245 [Westiellopsis prolifica IICB1]|nr:hypothetical protein B4U84_29245 [Westiellopsis prolifica IICB1]
MDYKIKQLYKKLTDLASIKFDNWNENDVREDFIKPLLNLLGYRKDTDYDINREGKHLLHKPFLMIGRKRVDVDYELLVRKKQFWLIEAKPAYPKKIQEQSIFQAHFYAMHPEVSARYFAVINGWEIVIYDSRNIDEKYQPILRISVDELPQRFQELNNILGAKNIIPMLKKRVLEDIHDILSVEVIDERLQEFSKEVNSILKLVRPVVQQNRINVLLRKETEHFANVKQELITHTFDEIIKIDFAIPVNLDNFQIIYELFIIKFEELNDNEKANVIVNIVSTLQERPSINHRRNLIHLLIRIKPIVEYLPKSVSYISINDVIVREIKVCLTHFKDIPLIAKFYQFECSIYRIAYKTHFFLNDWFEPLLKRLVKFKKDIWQDEEIVFQNPSLPSERLEKIDEFILKLYYQNKDLDENILSQLNSELDQYELAINERAQEEVAKIPSNDRIIINYENFNNPYDYLNSGLFHILSFEIKLVIAIVNQEILDLSLELLQRKFTSKIYSLNWVEVFIVKYLYYTNRYEFSADLNTDNSNNELLVILEKLIEKERIFADFVEEKNDENKVIKIKFNGNNNEQEDCLIEGYVSLDSKKLIINSLQRKPLFSKNPIKPLL